MRVRNPAPEYVDVDPSQVTVESLPRSFTGGLEAWAFIRTGGPLETFSLSPSLSYSIPREPEGFRVRVAYQDAIGNWCSEGTIRREAPPESIMNQIYDLQVNEAKTLAMYQAERAAE